VGYPASTASVAIFRSMPLNNRRVRSLSGSVAKFDSWRRARKVGGGSRRFNEMIDFKGSQFERDIILWGVRWYVAYPISYRQLEEMMAERGVEVDHPA
jgi:hypothetical protein